MNRRYSGKKIKKTLTVLAFLSLWIIGFSSLFVYAIGQSLAYSFTNYNLMNTPKWVGAANYAHLLFHDQVFWETLGNSALFVLILVPGILIVSFALALLVNTGTRFAGFSSVAYFLPFVIPLAATGLVWRWMFNSEYGVINFVLGLANLPAPNWLASGAWVKPAIALAEMTLIGQYFIIFVAALQEVPKELYEAAEIDGANSFRRIISVTIPMVSPAILFNLVTCFIIEFQIFDMPYIMTLNGGSSMQAKAAGGPGWSSTTFAMYMYHKMFNEYDASTASAMAMISLVLVLAISVILMKVSSRYVNYEK